MQDREEVRSEPYLISPDYTSEKSQCRPVPFWRSQRCYVLAAAIFLVVGACILIHLSIRDNSTNANRHNPTGHNIFTLRSQSPTIAPNRISSTEPSFSPSTQQIGMTPSHSTGTPSSQPPPTSSFGKVPSSQSRQPPPESTSMPSSFQSLQPESTSMPSSFQSLQPESTSMPSSFQSLQPSLEPSSLPSAEQTSEPTLSPSLQPTSEPTLRPSLNPSPEPTPSPSLPPTLNPSSFPSLQPTSNPSFSPSFSPTLHPSSFPSWKPLSLPTFGPSSLPTVQPSPLPTQAPTTPSTLRPTRESSRPAEVSSDVMVGAYYYPWYSRDFHGRQYVREHLNQTPSLGEYSDRNPAVLAQHLKWSRKANIGLWVSSWWGPFSREDVTLRDHILIHESLEDMKIALFYETEGRIQGDNETHYILDRVFPDIQYMCDNYFSLPNYYRIQGRPVIAVYLTRWLERLGLLQEMIETIRLAAKIKGYNIFIVGDHAFGRPNGANSTASLKLLDAVSSYDVYGAMPNKPYALQEGVNRYFRAQDEWIRLSKEAGCAYIPSVSPGFNDRGVRLDKNHTPLSRRLSPSREHGTLFEEVLRQAMERVQPANILLVNSFNEWHEDTQIEPVAGPPYQRYDNYTLGIEYVGYGELYLDILKRMTTSVPATKVHSGYRLLAWWRSLFQF